MELGFRKRGTFFLYCLVAFFFGRALNAARFDSDHFTVYADDIESATRIGRTADGLRIELAKLWLGRELAPWTVKCPILVTLTAGESGGVTSFGFAQGTVTERKIRVEGRLSRILLSGLPHEIMHVVIADHFGRPIPRWADEGLALLAEDVREKNRHNRMAERMVERGADASLEELFRVEEYPSDLFGFYAQSFSVTRFLVEKGGRARFLGFLNDVGTRSWDDAAVLRYNRNRLPDLQRAWRRWVQESISASVPLTVIASP